MPKLTANLALETTAKEAEKFAQIQPPLPQATQVKIAYLGNESDEQRLAAIQTLRSNQFDPMPIISAKRITSVDALEHYLSQAIEHAQISQVFLVGGDPATAAGPFQDSLALINSGVLDQFAAHIKMVGIAGYPEGHPKISEAVLWQYLQAKRQALQTKGFNTEITTQLAFDVSAVIAWIKDVREAGIDIPIRVGIPSPSSLKGLLKFASLCRVSTTANMLRQYGWQATSLLSSVDAGLFLKALAQEMCETHLGDIRLHIYPMGDLNRAAQWLDQQRS